MDTQAIPSLNVSKKKLPSNIHYNDGADVTQSMNMSNFMINRGSRSFKPAKVDKKILREFQKTSALDSKYLKNQKLKNDYYYTYANFHKKTK